MAEPRYSWSAFNIDIGRGSHEHRYVVCPNCSPYRKKKKLRTLGIHLQHYSWGCNHCGFSGSLYKGVLNQGDAFRNKKAESSVTYAEVKYDENHESEPVKLYEWFAKRGISKETVDEFKITVKKENFASQEVYNVDTICFPYMRDGEVVNIKYRGPNKMMKQVYQAEKIVYNLDDMKPFPDENGDLQPIPLLIICEGEIDVLSVKEAINIYNKDKVEKIFIPCISVPDGAPTPDATNYSEKFTYLESIEPYLKDIREVILMVDSDTPGKRLEEELSTRIGKYKCKRVTYPDKCKDINDVLITYGYEKVFEVMTSVNTYPVDGIYTASDLSKQLWHIFDNGIEPGVELHWLQNIKKLYRVDLKEWSLVTGVPGSGKSEFVEDLQRGLAQNYRWKSAIFSPEHDLAYNMIRMAKKITNKAFKIKGLDEVLPFEDYMTREEFQSAMTFIDEHFSWVEKESGSFTLQDLLERFNSLKTSKGCKGFVIDPYNKMNNSRAAHLTETEYISEQLNDVTQFVKKTNSHLWMLAHPSKLKKIKKQFTSQDGKKSEREVYPVPTPSDVSGSSHWWNKAFNAIAVHREGQEINAKGMATGIYVQKIKMNWNGELGLGRLKFVNRSGRFEDYRSPGLKLD